MKYRLWIAVLSQYVLSVIVSGCGANGGESLSQAPNLGGSSSTMAVSSSASNTTGPSDGDGLLSPVLSNEITRSPGGRAGMQIILLPFWSSGSVTNFLSVFKDSHGGYTAGPSRLAISFAPYLYGPPANYVNARTILNALNSGGKDVSVTVFLDRGDYHRGGTGADSDIEKSTSDFNSNFLKGYAGKVALSVCPSLEDHASKADIDRWATKIAGKIDPAYIKYVAFRRNPDANFGTNLPSQGNYRAVQLELHGPPGAGTLAGAAYSNDGTFVGKSNETITTEYVKDQSPNSLIGPFAKAIRDNGYAGTVLLWRPAYNLFKRSSKNGKTNFDRTNRDLSDAQVSFDANEVQVLKEFFGS